MLYLLYSVIFFVTVIGWVTSSLSFVYHPINVWPSFVGSCILVITLPYSNISLWYSVPSFIYVIVYLFFVFLYVALYSWSLVTFVISGDHLSNSYVYSYVVVFVGVSFLYVGILP